MMIIVKDERKIEDIVTCTNCGQVSRGRMEEVRDAMMSDHSRGFYPLCFDCCGPRIYWRRSWDDQTVFKTPVNWSEDVKGTKPLNYR